mgnify:CR=1 FL=1
MYRIGLGQDSHKIIIHKNETNKPLTLGGIIIDKQIEVLANSDGDMIIHSLCNALNTAIGKGSFDKYAGPMCKKGIKDSKEYLAIACDQIKKEGYQINNISISLEAGNPPLEKHRKRITESLSSLLSLEKVRIGISSTSGNGLTSFSKGKGIRCNCIVSLMEIEK